MDLIKPGMAPFIFLAALIFAFLTSGVAESKGHNLWSWAVIGLLFGPVGLIAAAGLGDLRTQRFLRLLSDQGGKHDPPSIKKSTPLSAREAAFLRGIQDQNANERMKAADRTGL